MGEKRASPVLPIHRENCIRPLRTTAEDSQSILYLGTSHQHARFLFELGIRVLEIILKHGQLLA